LRKSSAEGDETLQGNVSTSLLLQFLNLGSILEKSFITLLRRKEAVMRRLVIGLTMLALLGPGMSLAQQTGPSMGGEFARGVASPVLSVVYFPAKFCVGVAGALLGGISGWATGGDKRAAEGIWRPMTGGSYFITPDVLDGKKPFLPFNGGPIVQPAPAPAPPGSILMP
jgi:hypothetical protein